MIPTFGRLLFPTDPDTEAVYCYLRLLGVRVTKTGVKTALGEHPDSHSLLSVSDVLSELGVDNIAVRVTAEQLAKIEAPFIAWMKSDDGFSLAVVKGFDDTKVTYMPPAKSVAHGKSQWKSVSKEKFLEVFQGIALVGETGEQVGQRDYATALAVEKRQRRNIVMALSLLPVLVATAIMLALYQQGLAALIPSLYTLLALLGTAVGCLLLLYEVDRHNPALRQVCSGGQEVDCASILGSKASEIFGISWSLIGFSYFSGTVFALLVGGITNPAIFQLLSLLSIVAIGYTAFSLYYQWRVAKQWCKLCLGTQGILVTLALLVLADGRLFNASVEFSSAALLTLAVCFVVPFLSGLLIVPTTRKAKEGENDRKELSKLKLNPQIFQALLEKQQAVIEPTEGLGITLGNPNAKHRLIKVCNPYCGPCAKAHPVIEEILHKNSNVQLQIIFTAGSDDKDHKAPPVKHLIAIAEKGEELLLKQALDDWYNAPKKDYEAFSQKYPMNGELAKQGEKLASMKKWCDAMEIKFTPTFFVDGYQLPEAYTIKDLNYLFKA